MFWLWNKKPKVEMIDKINNIKVLCEKHSHIYKLLLQLNRCLTDTAKESLKPVIKEFILAVSTNIYDDCYWLVSAHDFFDFCTYCDNAGEYAALEEKMREENPFISYVVLDAFHIWLLLDKMNKEVFETMKNLKLPDGEALDMEVTDASFLAFYTDDIERLLKEIAETKNIGEIFNNMKSRIDISYLDSIGAKIHELAISCPPGKESEVKACLTRVFNRHGIELEFIDKIEKVKKG